MKCDLSNKSKNNLKKLIQLIKETSINCTILNLSANQLGTVQEQKKITKLYNSISKTITKLDLSSNILGGKKNWTHSNLESFSKNFPKQIESVNLTENNLFYVKSSILAKFLMEISQFGLKSIVLANNQLGELSAENISEILKGISSNITTLSLSGNFSSKNTAEEISEVLQALPSGVNLLDFSNNGLENKYQVLLSIPENINTIILSGNGLDDMDDEERYGILSFCPIHVKSVIINDETIFLDHLVESESIKKHNNTSNLKEYPSFNNQNEIIEGKYYSLFNNENSNDLFFNAEIKNKLSLTSDIQDINKGKDVGYSFFNKERSDFFCMSSPVNKAKTKDFSFNNLPIGKIN